jgi:GNAT superfamily N-acetyltransferase
MTLPLDLRAAQTTDAGTLAEILSGFIDDTDWMPRIHTRAEDLAHMGTLIDRGWVTVAQQGDRIAGFLACHDGWVHALYLAPRFRGRGLGKALLDHAKSRHSQLDLWTFQANGSAQRFYLREGFRETARTDGADNDENLPDIHYVWAAPEDSPQGMDEGLMERTTP